MYFNSVVDIRSSIDKALIAVVHPVVTIMNNTFQNKKFRQENLSTL